MDNLERGVEEWEKEFDERFEPMPDWLVGKSWDEDDVAEFNKARLRIKDFIHHQLQKAREGWLEEMEREIADLRAEHANTARHGNDPDSAYDRVEGMLCNKKQSNHSELDQPTELEECTCTYTPWGTRIVDEKCISSIHKGNHSELDQEGK